MGIEPTSETWKAIERDGLPCFLTSLATRIRKDSLHSASPLPHICVTMSLAMSAMILTGNLWAVPPGRTAIVGNPGEQWLEALQQIDSEVRALGARIVALTPELERYTRTVHKN
jgi:hypothetical protein